MEPFTSSVTIDRPREEVFAFLADVANRESFCDHYLTDWRLTREDSFGYGAGARFRVKAPLQRFGWADLTLVELETPGLIVERGRGGKYNRVRTRGVWELIAEGAGRTRVRYTFETQPKLPSDRIQEVLGGGWWTRRNVAKALRRLGPALEAERSPGRRTTVSGGPRKPASAYRYPGSAA